MPPVAIIIKKIMIWKKPFHHGQKCKRHLHTFKYRLVKTGCTFQHTAAPLQKPVFQKGIYSIGRLVLHICLDGEWAVFNSVLTVWKERLQMLRGTSWKITLPQLISPRAHILPRQTISSPAWRQRITTVHETIILLIFYDHTPLRDRAQEFVTW